MLPAVYLAAGEGSRLRPLTADRPKAMLDVGGVPLARRALESLRRAGVTEVVAVTGYRAEAWAPVGGKRRRVRRVTKVADHRRE